MPLSMEKIYRRYPTEESCIKHLEKVLWKSGPVCPYCRSRKNSKVEKENRYHCNFCDTSFRVTVGTVFHKTKIDLRKWFLAMTLLTIEGPKISTRKLSHRLDVNKNTASSMIMRIRAASLQDFALLDEIMRPMTSKFAISPNEV